MQCLDDVMFNAVRLCHKFIQAMPEKYCRTSLLFQNEINYRLANMNEH